MYECVNAAAHFDLTRRKLSTASTTCGSSAPMLALSDALSISASLEIIITCAESVKAAIDNALAK